MYDMPTLKWPYLDEDVLPEAFVWRIRKFSARSTAFEEQKYLDILGTPPISAKEKHIYNILPPQTGAKLT